MNCMCDRRSDPCLKLPQHGPIWGTLHQWSMGEHVTRCPIWEVVRICQNTGGRKKIVAGTAPRILGAPNTKTMTSLSKCHWHHWRTTTCHALPCAQCTAWLPPIELWRSPALPGRWAQQLAQSNWRPSSASERGDFAKQIQMKQIRETYFICNYQKDFAKHAFCFFLFVASIIFICWNNSYSDLKRIYFCCFQLASGLAVSFWYARFSARAVSPAAPESHRSFHRPPSLWPVMCAMPSHGSILHCSVTTVSEHMFGHLGSLTKQPRSTKINQAPSFQKPTVLHKWPMALPFLYAMTQRLMLCETCSKRKADHIPVQTVHQ